MCVSYRCWTGLDQALKHGQHHYLLDIEWIWIGGFILEGTGRIDKRGLTIQQHDPRCVGGSQQRLTPGVSAHGLIRESAAERLGLPRLQHIDKYKDGMTH